MFDVKIFARKKIAPDFVQGSPCTPVSYKVRLKRMRLCTPDSYKVRLKRMRLCAPDSYKVRLKRMRLCTPDNMPKHKKTPFLKKNGVFLRPKNLAYHTFMFEMQNLPCQ